MIWICRCFYVFFIGNCLAKPPLSSQKSNVIFNCFNCWSLAINHKKCLLLSKKKLFWIRNTIAVVGTFGKQNQTPELWKIKIIWTILYPWSFNARSKMDLNFKRIQHLCNKMPQSTQNKNMFLFTVSVSEENISFHFEIIYLPPIYNQKQRHFQGLQKDKIKMAKCKGIYQ